MPCGRIRAHNTGVITTVSSGPEIFPSWELRTRVGMWPCGADKIALEFGDCAGELGDFQQGSENLGMGHCHLGSDHDVGGGQH